MRYDIAVVVFVALGLNGCASQSIAFTTPEGPLCVLDGQNILSLGNVKEGDESWFRLANAMQLNVDSHIGDYTVVEIEKDTGVQQNDFERKSFQRTVVMTARPSIQHVYRTKDDRGIILVSETEGRVGLLMSDVITAFSANEEVEINDLADMPNDNVFIIMIANGDADEVIVRKQRRGSNRSCVAITKSMNSLFTLVGMLDLYLPTEERFPSPYQSSKEREQQEAEDIIRELEQSEDTHSRE